MSWWNRIRSWWTRRRGQRQAVEVDAARQEFHQQRERLEAVLFDLAASSGKPRGLRWIEIDFDNDVVYARQLSTKELCALVAVTVSFEAIEGGPMEEVEAVGRKRAATAVFRRGAGAWSTDGRLLFNLSPADAVQRFHDDLVLVEPVVDKVIRG